MLLRIRTFVGRHLADPDLTPEVIARAHHISVRYLHKIFEGEDTTVSRWIQSSRLEACRRDLLHREAANRTIVAVARRWGFTSAAHSAGCSGPPMGCPPASGATPTGRSSAASGGHQSVEVRAWALTGNTSYVLRQSISISDISVICVNAAPKKSC
jgi:AraC-like DNA-binding protein